MADKTNTPSAAAENEEVKAVKEASAPEAQEVHISDKLDGARELINRADAGAKASRGEQEKMRREHENEAKRRTEEAAAKRAEDEKQAKALAQQKLAYLNYAENYRKKLREEKEKVSAAKAKAIAKRQEEAARAREESERQTAEMLTRELAEITARGARADELLDKVKTDKEAQAVQEAEARRIAEAAEAKAEAEALAAQRAAEAAQAAEAARIAQQAAAASQAATEEDIDMTIVITTDDEDESKKKDEKLVIDIAEEEREPEGVVNVDGKIYPEEAFDNLMGEKVTLMRAIDDHYRAYEAEMERLRQKHMHLRMQATANAAAERSEEFKLLAAEEARYNKEVAELAAKREAAAKDYLARKEELERAIGEYNAHREELAGANSAVHNVAVGTAETVSALATGIAAGAVIDGTGSDVNAIIAAERATAEAKIEKEKALAEALIEKEKALAEARIAAHKAETELKYERERAETLAKFSAEKAAADARIAELERESAIKGEIAKAEAEKVALVKSEAQKLANEIENRSAAATDTVKVETAPTVHIISPGAIDKKNDDEAKAIAEAEHAKRAAVILAEKSQIEAMTLKELPKFLKKSAKEEAALEKEYEKLASTATETKAEKIVLIVDSLGVKRRIIEKLCDDVKACKLAGAGTKISKNPVAALNRSVEEYNTLVDEYYSLTGHTLTHADANTAERILAGEKYTPIPTVTARREVVSAESGKTVSKVNAADVKGALLKVDTVVGGVHQINEEKPKTESVAVPAGTAAAAIPETKVALSAVTITDKELPKYFKKQKKAEKNLNEKLKALSDAKPTNTEESVVLIVERLGTERDLIESLIKDLKLAKRAGNKKKLRAYKKQLKSAITDYNKIADEYEKLTGDKLTKADITIPDRIVNGERYTAIPVISYRKETLDGSATPYVSGSATAGAAYALLPEKERRRLEKSGAIKAAGATAITGLSKREAKASLKAEKKALKEEAVALTEAAKADEKRAKETKKLAKAGSKAEKKTRLEEANALSNKSREEKALAKEKAKTAKELKNVKDYEKYLQEKADKRDSSALTAAAVSEYKAQEESAPVKAKKLTKAEKKAAKKAAKAEAKAQKKTEKRGDVATAAAATSLLAGLSKREAKAKMKAERESLIAEANALEAESKAKAAEAKQEKQLAKSGSKAERKAHKTAAEELAATSASSKALAKEKIKTAKSLKNLKAYEKYLATASSKAPQEREVVDDSKYESYLAASAAISQLSADNEKVLKNKLSKRERKANMKAEREALVAQSKTLESEAKETARRAKEEKKLAKKSKKADRAQHAAEAERLAAQSEDKKALAKEKANTAKELKNLKAYDKYSAKKSAKEADRLARAQRTVDDRLGKVTVADESKITVPAESDVKIGKEAELPTKTLNEIAFDKKTVNAFCREQSENDEYTLLRSYETKIAELEHKLEMSRLKFGTAKRKEKKALKRSAAEVKVLKKELKRSMKAEAANNKRYYSVIKTDIPKEKFGKKTDKATLTSLKVELEGLLCEREKINTKLTALYDGSDSGKKSLTDMRRGVSAGGATKAYKKQKKLASKIDSLHITVEEKSKIYQEMDAITAIDSAIASCEHQLKVEKVKGKARREAKRTIKAKKSERKVRKKKLKYLTDRAFRKAGKEARERKTQAIFIVVLLLVVAAAVAGYIFRAEIMGYVNQLIANFGGAK